MAPAVLDPVGDRIAELLTLASRPSWHKRASCRGQDPRLWYPERRGQRAAGREICRGCPVQPECREWAIVHGEELGMWGATTPAEREAERRQRPDLAARPRREQAQSHETWTFGSPPFQKPTRSTSRSLPADSWRWWRREPGA